MVIDDGRIRFTYNGQQHAVEVDFSQVHEVSNVGHTIIRAIYRKVRRIDGNVSQRCATEAVAFITGASESTVRRAVLKTPP